MRKLSKKEMKLVKGGAHSQCEGDDGSASDPPSSGPHIDDFL